MKKVLSIFLTIVFILSLNISVYSKSVNQLNKEKNEIKNKIENSKDSLQKSKEQKSSILKEVEKLDANLDKIETELEDLEKKLNQTKESLAQSEKELKDAKEKKEKQYKSLKERIRVMYEYGDSGYISILLEAKGFTDFFKRIEYVNYIIKHDNKLFERYKETEEFIALKVEQIKVEKSNLEVLTKQTQDKKQEVQKNISSKQQMVANLNKQQASLEQQIKDLQKEDNAITNLINQAKVKSTGASTNKVYPGKGGRFAHPVPAYAGRPYNDVYGYRANPISGRRELHSGLDLKATYGTDIVAAENGTVIYSGNRGGYGKTVIIDHGGGISTLYAHNSKLVVSKGQQVKRGQVIAKAGSTGYSTGVHAHFEVRINGKHTDPAPYLK
ncbi:peptidoglycan DD-metalloendopeptidase family protein [uncultured Tyzzerella sp.]|uniref:murein hydrolase activator EnvC family protein n=1 Tax=uncultured Tyzzerella sp. TaxID=2321398 RepID=UPI0029433D59|nr:peptidoglycan DD-metalloendopeptidase family protein [uncultured Tyzzerella sp.]